MKRRFTKYPSNYVRASVGSNSDTFTFKVYTASDYVKASTDIDHKKRYYVRVFRVDESAEFDDYYDAKAYALSELENPEVGKVTLFDYYNREDKYPEGLLRLDYIDKNNWGKDFSYRKE